MITNQVAFQHITDIFKVISTDTHRVPNSGGQTVSFGRSALLNSSKGVTQYLFPTPNKQAVWTSPALDGTPIIAFESKAAALAFANEASGREVWKAEALARFVLPVTTVLNLSLGWDEKAKAFWQAYLTNGDLSRFETRPAPAGSVGIFGTLHLIERVTR